MKKIKLQQITEPLKDSIYIKQRMYFVSLGSGKKEYFSNRKDARKYLALANRFLNHKLHEANYLFVQMFAAYREIWFHLESIEMRTLNKNIIMLSDCFNTICEQSTYTNGNHLAYHNFDIIAGNIIECFKIIQDVNRQKLFYTEVQKNEMFIEQAARLYEAVKNYNPAADLDFLGKEPTAFEILE